MKKITGKRQSYAVHPKENGSSKGAWLLISVIFFVLIFCYLSLNLKNVEYGYQMQELTDKEKTLKEEINHLKAERASLLNLERVEKKVIGELGYQYPRADQFIKVFKDQP